MNRDQLSSALELFGRIGPTPNPKPKPSGPASRNPLPNRKLSKVLESNCRDILNEPWASGTARAVPDLTTFTLARGSREFECTMLYADLAGSTDLQLRMDNQSVAKIIKCFLTTCTRLIHANGGQIRSFDGDRVMGVFSGNMPNSRAVKAALQINWAVQNVVEPLLANTFACMRNSAYRLRYGIGIDTSKVLVVKAGIRGSNDLVWVGRAANFAAKLSDIRAADKHTFITESVYSKLSRDLKLANGVDMWERYTWNPHKDIPTYGSNFWWIVA